MKPRREIAVLKPYRPPLAGRTTYSGLLLDFNERAVPPPYITAALRDVIAEQNFYRYPDYGALEEQLADYVGVESANKIMVANGSDQIIDVVFRTFTAPGSKVIIPGPSFAMFEHSARVNGNEVVQPVYRGSQLTFPFEQVMDALDDEVQAVVICNPNNPTGGWVAVERVRAIAKRARNAVVLVDEAYFEFSQISAVELLAECPNIIISRTFSKAFGLAGLRVGYCIAAEQIIEQLVKVRGPYAVNMLAYKAAQVALEHVDYVATYAREVMQSAKPMVEQFFTENGVVYLESAANFLLVRHPNALEFAAQLKAGGALVRLCQGPNIDNTFRITVGTTAQIEEFIAIYKQATLTGDF